MPTRNEIISGRRLSRLPRTQFSGLDFDNIIQDITELVRQNPNFNENWDDFLSSNAGRMMVELFAYITDQLATRIDWVVNENFIGTATQRKSIIRILKLIGYNLSLPVAASVPVTINFDRPFGSYVFSGSFDSTTADLNLFSLSARDRSGATKKNFEAIAFDEQNNRFEYTQEIRIGTGSNTSPNLTHVVNFYEGTTFIETSEVETENNFVVDLPRSPVIKFSPRVYRLLGENNEEQEELLQVESFLDPRAQRVEDAFGRPNPIPYIVNVLENNTVTIEFGPTSLLPDAERRPSLGDRIRVFYRVGGGFDGNITRRSINVTRREIINNVTTNVSYVNNLPGVEGTEAEDPEFAAIFGPLQIRTAQKAVTEEDYDILLASDPRIIKSKSYGNNNLPANLFNFYNLFIRPLEVWNYILVDKPGWRETPPSRYNDFEWITLRQENRFNEVHAFSEGSFNQNILIGALAFLNKTETEIEWREGQTITARNYALLQADFRTPEQDDLFIFSDDFRSRLTIQELEDNFFDLANINNFFNPLYELFGQATFRGRGEVFQLKQDINAHLVSRISFPFTPNVDTSQRFKIKLGFDNRESVEVILPKEESFRLAPIDGESSPPNSVLAEINKAFKKHKSYNNDDTSSEPEKIKGSHRLNFDFESESSRPKRNITQEDASQFIAISNGGNDYNLYWLNINDSNEPDDPEPPESVESITIQNKFPIVINLFKRILFNEGGDIQNLFENLKNNYFTIIFGDDDLAYVWFSVDGSSVPFELARTEIDFANEFDSSFKANSFEDNYLTFTLNDVEYNFWFSVDESSVPVDLARTEIDFANDFDSDFGINDFEDNYLSFNLNDEDYFFWFNVDGSSIPVNLQKTEISFANEFDLSFNIDNFNDNYLFFTFNGVEYFFWFNIDEYGDIPYDISEEINLTEINIFSEGEGEDTPETIKEKIAEAFNNLFLQNLTATVEESKIVLTAIFEEGEEPQFSNENTIKDFEVIEPLENITEIEIFESSDTPSEIKTKIAQAFNNLSIENLTASIEGTKIVLTAIFEEGEEPQFENTIKDFEVIEPFNLTKIDVFSEGENKDTPETIKTKIAQAFNNLSIENLTASIEGAKIVLTAIFEEGEEPQFSNEYEIKDFNVEEPTVKVRVELDSEYDNVNYIASSFAQGLNELNEISDISSEDNGVDVPTKFFENILYSGFGNFVAFENFDSVSAKDVARSLFQEISKDFNVSFQDTTVTVTNQSVGTAGVPIFCCTEGVFRFVEVITEGTGSIAQVISFDFSRPFLVPNRQYFYKLNGIQYSFVTGTNPQGPDYTELIDLLRESVRFRMSVDFSIGNLEARINEGKDYIHFIKKGMKVRPLLKTAAGNDETSVIEALEGRNIEIQEENWVAESLIFKSENARVNTTSDNYRIFIYPFDVEKETFIITEVIIDFEGTVETTLNGEYIEINTPNEHDDYYFYFTTVSGQNDPNISEKEAIEVFIEQSDEKQDVINKLVEAVEDASLENIFDVSVRNSVVQIRNIEFGDVEDSTSTDTRIKVDTIRKNDIFFTNLREDPVGPTWIQEAQNVLNENNFFFQFEQNMSIRSYLSDFMEESYGVGGEQELGINGATEPNRGFQCFEATALTPATGSRNFRLTVDEENPVNITVLYENLTTLNGLIDRINTAISGSAIALIDSTGRITIRSEKSGSGPKIRIEDVEGSGISLIPTLGGLKNSIDGIDSPKTGLEYNKPYKFILNNHEFEIVIENEERDNLQILREKIEEKISPYGYTIELISRKTNENGSLEDDDWSKDFLVKFVTTSERVRFEDIDLFKSLNIKKLFDPSQPDSEKADENEYEVLDKEWEDFESPIGGGDYSNVARLFTFRTPEAITRFFSLFSPSVSESSVIEFSNLTSTSNPTQDVSVLLFGDSDISQEVVDKSYGYNRATIILNENAGIEDSFGRVLYENGSLNFRGFSVKESFYHFINEERQKIVIGRYFTDDFPFDINFGRREDDPSWREPARRIFNTTYNDEGDVDINQSRFDTRFTISPTEEMSLYSIQNSWNLRESDSASVISVPLTVEVLEDEETIVIVDGDIVNGNNYIIRVNIDGIKDLNIDITGDQGSSAQYTLQTLATNITNAIRNDSDYSAQGIIYRTFNFAIIDPTGERLIIRSPINSEVSLVKLSEPTAAFISNDVTGPMFNLDTSPGYFHEFFADGDYYIDLNKTTIRGRFTDGLNRILFNSDDLEFMGVSNISELGIEPGYKILPIPDVLISSFVILVDEENNQIFLDNSAIATTGGISFEITDDLMSVARIPKPEGRATFPDLRFYFHFINDKRFVEDAFDGRNVSGAVVAPGGIVGTDENIVEVRTGGFQLGELDEDVFNELLADRKIVGVDNIFKQTKFSTFDLQGIIFYRNTFSRVDIQTRVEASLRRAFSLETRGYGELVARSTILNIIHSNEGIEYVDLTYLGPDLIQQETNVDSVLQPRFDEIIVLSENIISPTSGIQTAGIEFEYRAVGA